MKSQAAVMGCHPHSTLPLKSGLLSSSPWLRVPCSSAQELHDHRAMESRSRVHRRQPDDVLWDNLELSEDFQCLLLLCVPSHQELSTDCSRKVISSQTHWVISYVSSVQLLMANTSQVLSDSDRLVLADTVN